MCMCVCCKLREQTCTYAYENYPVKEETIRKVMEGRQPTIQRERDIFSKARGQVQGSLFLEEGCIL